MNNSILPIPRTNHVRGVYTIGMYKHIITEHTRACAHDVSVYAITMTIPLFESAAEEKNSLHG